MNWDIIVENLGLYAAGAKLTLLLTVVSLALSFFIAVPLALARNSPSPLLRYPVFVYTLIFRGTPLLVQLFLIYFGLAQFELVRTSIVWPWLSSPLVCVLIAFVMNTTAYSTEIFAGGLRHIPFGEVEAARAYGMSPLTRARRILIPAMLTRSLPLYGNETIMMLQATSLASTVTLLEITGVARNITLTYYVQFEPYATAAMIYLVFTFILVGLFQLVERRWAGYLEHRVG
ncbi:ABC transporter permease [Phyllobacterium endophyticum]|uniref:Amino acid ABC transporter permease n=1 Tax=Phyllobacterium endophyticum TaxID=1149773 RepID=A0A2P7ARG4_9HYPH|nr:ABC transporter permease subunit [Phyllobacterium endophyticum]MBB3237485.1 arginine/ornithine transport system permease protein [Phyllobacterium endophyticum]PSH56808.1 amino acid ABC transporter permease [Phyllobacterium endophyticum]TYR44208.1 ABC transporter permease subunit [Phyllobacterium endophyticum]